VAKPKDKAGLKLVTAEAQDAEKRFRELYDRTNKQTGARESDVKALRDLMSDNAGEKLWRRIPGPLRVAEDFALEHSPGITPGVAECWRLQLTEMKKDLAGENPSEVERLLAYHAALCWLRLAEVELHYTSKLGTSHTLTLGTYYDKRPSMAQRRFTRACETLERVRMMRRRAGRIGEAGAERRRA
jgi:hypothetical protein